MAPYHGFERIPLEVRPGKRPRVEQHLLNIPGEGIPVPDAEMVKLVPAKKEPFDVERREQMIDPSHPLGHTVVVRILRFEREFVEAPRSRGGNISLVSA